MARSHCKKEVKEARSESDLTRKEEGRGIDLHQGEAENGRSSFPFDQ